MARKLVGVSFSAVAPRYSKTQGVVENYVFRDVCTDGTAVYVHGAGTGRLDRLRNVKEILVELWFVDADTGARSMVTERIKLDKSTFQQYL